MKVKFDDLDARLLLAALARLQDENLTAISCNEEHKPSRSLGRVMTLADERNRLLRMQIAIERKQRKSGAS